MTRETIRITVEQVIENAGPAARAAFERELREALLRTAAQVGARWRSPDPEPKSRSKS